MNRNNNILLKLLLILVLVGGWGGHLLAQTTQLPLTSGIYEIQNISNEGGAGTGRGYLVNYTVHNSGLGLAECTWAAHAGKHPNNRNNGSTTCSYWYLHAHEDGFYTLVSLSTLGGNNIPRFLLVANSGGKSSLTNNANYLAFTTSTKNEYVRDGKRAVLISNKTAQNVYLSGGCGTNSNSGSIMATTTATDGGNPWLFKPVDANTLTTAQLAIRDKYLASLVANRLQFSPAPSATAWADGMNWFTIHNNRNAKGYLSTQDSGLYLDNNAKLTIKNGANASGDRGGLWAFVEKDGGFNIYNNAYGPDFVLGVTGSGGGARMQMYPKDDIPSGVSTVFTHGANSTHDGGAAYAYYFRIGTTGTNHLNEQGGYPGTWAPGGTQMTTDAGSAFTVTLVSNENIHELPQYDVYKAAWAGLIPSEASITYADNTKVFGKRGSANNGDYMILQHESSTDLSAFTVNKPSEYGVALSVQEPAGSYIKTLKFTFSDALATEEWTVNVPEGYTVNYKENGYTNGESFFLRPGQTPDRRTLTINGADDKFVWGPIIDAKEQTVTYEVRDRAETLEDGWYQLQITGSADYIATLSNKIKPEEGNINTEGNTLYLAPANYATANNKIFKVTGVPRYAGEAATYVYIQHGAGNTYTFVNPSNGKSMTDTQFIFSNGVLTKTGYWNYETTAHPLEGPYMHDNTDGQHITFNVSPVDISGYEIYRVSVLDNDDNPVDARLNINNSDVLGNKTVANGGYIFMHKDAVTPFRSQFTSVSGDVTVVEVTPGDKVDGITPLTISTTTRQTLWRARITGDAKEDADRVIYNGINYVNDALMALPFGYTPTAMDFKTNVTDRFVWGPIIDEKAQTVTFEVRTTATNLEAGAWYQLQLSPTAEGRYFVPNETGNLVEGVLKMNPRNAGSQIYMIGANKTSGSWTVELIGKPANEAETYLYINYRNGNTTQMMMQNGYYITNQSQYSSSASNTQFQYNSETHEFHWRNPVYPWGNLNGMTAAVGKSANADGPIKVIAHKAPVKAYKVVLSNGLGTLVYNGDAEIIGSNRAAHGSFFFAKEGEELEGEESTIDISKFDLRGVDATINSITASTTGGFTTLNVNVSARTYNNEIIHKQNRYYDHLETDANKPDEGFIQDGEGWSIRTGSEGEIREQNTSVFEIPVYLKQGTSMESYLPTNQLNSYQRWYNWDTDGQVDETVLTNTRNARDKSFKNLNTYTQYNNGYVVFRGSNRTDNDAYVPVLTLPTTMEEYNVGLDISRMTDYVQNPSGASDSAIEPTLGMRIVYQVRDAKQIANAIKTASDADKFYEVHDIALPNVQYGSRESRLQDRTLSTTLPLDMDLNNYWGFNNGGTGNDNLVQLTQDNQLRVTVEGNAPIQNVKMIPGSANAASGNISRTSFNTGHFVLFQYPDNGYIEPNATATVNVYMTSGNVEYKLVQFNLTFISNAHPIVVTELKNSYRHPDALAEQFGAPVTELTFDQTPNSEYSTTEAGVTYPDYRYPLDYKGASYAFGMRNDRNWAASRGEYALTSFNASSAQTGTPRIAYYPVTNYFSSMADPSAALGPKKEGAYQLYIDAADQPGKIASIELKDALCAGSRLYCYGYIGCTSGGTGHHPTSVLINVMGINKDTDKEELIYSYCPGIITLRGYAEDGRTIYSTALGSSSSYSTREGAEDRNYWAPWQQIGFSFAIGAETAAKMSGYSIQIMNNAYNSNGGDTMLDDFQIFVKKPGAEVQNTTPLCSDQIRHIKVITEYNTLIEATGEDSNHDGLMNVGFCFLDKEVYDSVLEANADKDEDHGYDRNNPENKYNKAFGEALMGVRTLDTGNKDHAFHNFNIIRDGQVSDIYGEEKVHYYTDIPQYSFKESGDDVVYRDSIRGERYIVFKESVAHGNDPEHENHKWTAGKAYYLLFSTATISEEHVNNHDLGCTVFGLDDSRCAVLHEFTVAPPVTIKGDAERITSGDEVQACSGQTATLSVNLNGRTDTKDVIIKNLNYDWWMSAPTHEVFKMQYGVPVRDANGNRIALDSDGNEIANDAEGNPVDPSRVQKKVYNTVPATLQNYMNVTWGEYSADHAHLDKKAGDPIYLSDALLEFRRAYPNATDLVGVVPVHKTGDTVEYDLTQDLINCVAHFLEPDENGYPPLLLMKKEMNLTLGIDYADKDKTVHFVVIPIAPSIYSVDEDAIYCPDPQELKVKLLDEAPSLANGFDTMAYPETMSNVPMRVGLQQLNAVRQRTSGTQRTLTVPLRKAVFAYPEVGRFLVKTGKPNIVLVGTDDPAYKKEESIQKDQQGDNFLPDDDDTEDMFITVGRVESLAIKKGDTSPSMQITFNNNAIFREGYTYTLKIKYYEVKEDGTERDQACEGSFVFDMKVVPEYQVWTGAVGNSDWTNDRNWARADRDELHAGKAATGNKMAGATALDDAASYASNAANTTANSFVPMYFTNVLIKQNGADAIELYKGGDFKHPVAATNFLEGLDANTSTPFISYDLEVAPVNAADRTAFNYDCNYQCELFDTYIANGVTFEPATQMGNAHYLTYNKAWVEYELDADRWYTIGSPLKNSYAGDWYSPTAGAKQLTPHFYDINYREDLNDRFRPAYYQRSWDRAGNNIVYEKSGGTYDSYVKADWSYVYNDAEVGYSNGGFSVKAEFDYMDPADRPTDGKVLVRMPKADESYTYYDVAGSTGQAADAQVGSRTQSYRLMSDDLGADGTGTFSHTVSNQTAGNDYLLLANPFVAAMDMDEFFEANPTLEKKYWIVDADRQDVSVKSADGTWITTGTTGGKYVAPMQGFFVKASGNSVSAKYTADMQKVVNTTPTTPAPALKVRTRAASGALSPGLRGHNIRLTAERNGASSTALIILSEGADDNYAAGEDCEAFIDGNLYAHPTVYTAAGTMAQTINVRKTLNMVPVGMISSDDSEATLRINIGADITDLYLYDSEEDSYTEVTDGTEVAMSGNVAGRYYLTTKVEDVESGTANAATINKGVYTISGAYLGESAEGLMPGIYVVDGVKMIIR